MNDRIILDLCGGTGAWGKPYKEAGYDVRNITLPEYDIKKTGFGIIDDILFFKDPEGNRNPSDWIKTCDVYGILAAPPCTMFSLARTKAKEPRDLKKGMELVRACLNIIWFCMEKKQDTRRKTVSLKFWALENPNGMLKYFLGEPAFKFSPYEFGNGYKKRTMLWGWFNEPKKKVGKIICNNAYGSLNPETMKKFDVLASREIAPELFGVLDRTERRAITPSGFAKAFFDANQ